MQLVRDRNGADLRAQYEDIVAYFDRFVDEADYWAAKTNGYHGLVRSTTGRLSPRVRPCSR